MNEFLTKILLSLSDWSKNLGGFGFSKGSLSADMLVGIFLAVVILLVAFGIGKTRMLLAIISTYVAYLVAEFFPFYSAVSKIAKAPGVFWTHLAIFAIAFALAFFILNKSVLKSKMSLRESPPLMILWLSIVETGLLVSLILSYWRPGLDKINFSPLLINYFSGDVARFVWVLLPLLSMLLIKHSRRPSIG
ncbi:MAG: hypothetical protein Q7S32_00180 [bacterium]|nr:hypothetical protein [bacterium]